MRCSSASSNEGHDLAGIVADDAPAEPLHRSAAAAYRGVVRSGGGGLPCVRRHAQLVQLSDLNVLSIASADHVTDF